MRLRNKQTMQQLLQMLRESLQKEGNHWKPRIYKVPQNQNVEIGPSQRDEIIRWLAQLKHKFDFNPETLALSVALVDKFLHTVKARPKYLRCIGIACFYLAAKTLEEDEVIPETMELLRDSRCGCTVSEVIRMERCILDKLSWDIKMTTSLDFLQIFHALLIKNYPHLLERFGHVTPSKQLDLLTYKLELVSANNQLLAFSPSTVALALTSLELELFMPNWLLATITMQRMIEIDNHSLIKCREIISRQLTTLKQHNYFVSMYRPAHTVNKPSKRKVDQMDDDDIYEGIKRLYGEDDLVPAVNFTPCSQEVRQDAEKAIPLPAMVN